MAPRKGRWDHAFRAAEKNAKESYVENRKKAKILLSAPSPLSAAIIHVVSPSGLSLSIKGTSKAKVFMAAVVLR